jgi:hypothetical protein
MFSIYKNGRGMSDYVYYVISAKQLTSQQLILSVTKECKAMGYAKQHTFGKYMNGNSLSYEAP